MNKLALSILLAPFGLFWGIWVVLWVLSLFFEEPHRQSDMDTSGLGQALVAIFIGAPVGAALFAYLGFRLGRRLDRRSENVPHKAVRGKTDLRTLKGFIIAGAVVGIIAFFATDPRGSPVFFIIAFGFLGCLIGYVRAVFLAARSKKSDPSP